MSEDEKANLRAVVFFLRFRSAHVPWIPSAQLQRREQVRLLHLRRVRQGLSERALEDGGRSMFFFFFFFIIFLRIFFSFTLPLSTHQERPFLSAFIFLLLFFYFVLFVSLLFTFILYLFF